MSSPKDGAPIQPANEATSIEGRVGDTAPISAESPAPGWLFALPVSVWDELLATFSLKSDKKDRRMPDVLSTLLFDRRSRKNIIFATDSYADLGEAYGPKRHITQDLLRVNGRGILQPRIQKSADEQLARTRQKGEVFTPTWVCCLMINYCDEIWFGKENLFGTLDGQIWRPSDKPIRIPEKKRWQAYVDSRRLEITCGEAPFLVSRYDMSTGKLIPIKMRVGILDRKLRIVNDNTQTEEEWCRWALRAIQSVYGYEYQGDNLLVARMNVVLSYMEYMKERWGRNPNEKELKEVAKVVSWNLWQMDGLTGAIPTGSLDKPNEQPLFSEVEQNGENIEEDFGKYGPCRIFDWRGQNKSVEFNNFKDGRNGSMKFDFIIGNPPYQEDVKNQGDRANPIYDKFMDASYNISNCVELIHPARFLFEAGQTPKAWMKKMLADKHLKVLKYWPKSSLVFSNIELKGGVAITIRDQKRDFGPIGTFTQFEQLNGIVKKVAKFEKNRPRMDSLIASQGLYRFSEIFFQDYPHAIGYIGKGTGNKVISSIMEKLPEVFLDEKGKDGEYVRFLGRINGQRKYKWIKRKYLVENDFIDKYNLFIPEANNNGIYGETLTEPEIGNKQDGASDTFLSAGPFETISEAQNLAIYMKTKFFRSFLGIRKVTQHSPQSVWAIVPIQNFTSTSDIDWSKSVAEVDRQLYVKYGLNKEEVEFIETHVEEMK